MPEAPVDASVRRLIVERPEDTITINTAGAPVVTVGPRVVDGEELAQGQPSTC